MPGVYISYPFCAQKCTYCNFASGVFPRELEPQYVNALVAEIAAHSWHWEPETVYSGRRDAQRNGRGRSGTNPRRDSGAAQWKEATIEVAPGIIKEELAAAWARTGINRVSLGVQSFVQRELARTGRKHTAEIVEREVGMLRSGRHREHQYRSDCRPSGTNRASWSESLAWIERLEPPHVSVYMLEVDEDSRLGSEVLLNGKRYGAPDVPSDELTAELYETAVAELARMGIHRYEISNFARPGFESRHNLKYWRLEPYVGFGADAHSFDGAVRRQNIELPSDYVGKIQSGQSACVGETTANTAEERFFVGLRLARGIELQPDDWRRFDDPIQRFIADGLLARDHERLAPHQSRRATFERSLCGIHNDMIIDLRSDTVTRPTPAMRRAMAEAEVGDDVYREDPTVNRLEQRAAEIMGKEAGLFVPTGTMGNTIAIKVHTDHGQEVICESRAHVLDWELSMLAWFCGLPDPAGRCERRHPALERHRSGDPSQERALRADDLDRNRKHAQHGGRHGLSHGCVRRHLRQRARTRHQGAYGWRAHLQRGLPSESVRFAIWLGPPIP